MFKKFGLAIFILVLTACSVKPSPSATTSVSSTSTQSALSPTIATVTEPRLRENITTSGIINQDETWRGEIYLTGDIQLANEATLTIEAGTTVFLTPNSDDRHQGYAYDDEYTRSHNDPVRLEEWSENAIIIDGRNGTINAIGTPEQPIIFQPEGENTSPAQWEGIFIERGTLQYAKVLYAGQTAVQILGNPNNVEIAHNEIRYFHWAGIDAHTSNVWIHHNTVEGGGHQGIGARLNTLVEYNVVIGAQTGIAVERGDGVIVRNNIVVDCARGMELRNGKNIEVSNNTIAWLNGPPDGWYYLEKLIYPAFEFGGGIENYLSAPGIKIINNIVYGPFDWGIGLHQQLAENSIVDYNLLWNQPTLYAGGGQSKAGIHNISQDPQFVDLDNRDFKLQQGSPAVDTGDPNILDADGSPSDLGAYGGPFATGW